MAEECFKWAREAKANAKTWTHDNVDSVGLCTTRGQDMCVLTSARHFGTLVVVPLLAGMLAFPASAQTSSDSNSTGTAGAQAQSEPAGGPTSSNPATPKTGSNTATPSTKTDSTAAKASLSGRATESDNGRLPDDENNEGGQSICQNGVWQGPVANRDTGEHLGRRKG